MCRYSGPFYRTHFACFSCRKSFKSDGIEVKCPQCCVNMARMGRDFHAPRKEAKGQWKKVQLLYDKGIVFDSCGCSGPGYRPKTFSEAKSFVARKRSVLR